MQVSGVALFTYLAIGLINYLHLWVPLPSVTLDASPFYKPNLGFGQLAVFLWLTVVSYWVNRQIHGLSPGSAALAAPLPVLLSLLLYLFSAGLFFRVLPLLPGWGPKDWLHLANLAYLITTVLLSLAMAAGRQRWLKAGSER